MVNDEIDFYIKFVRYNSYITYMYGGKKMTVEIDFHINFNDLQRIDSHFFHVFNLLSFGILRRIYIKFIKFLYNVYIGDKKNNCQNRLSLKFSRLKI